MRLQIWMLFLFSIANSFENLQRRNSPSVIRLNRPVWRSSVSQRIHPCRAKDLDRASFARPGIGSGWEADVYVFALEDTLVPTSRAEATFESFDKKYGISGDVIFSRINGVLNRMKQPFYIISEANEYQASEIVREMASGLKDFEPNSPRLYSKSINPEERVESLKKINGKTMPGIQLSYVDTNVDNVKAVLACPELNEWKVYWANWAGNKAPSEYETLDRARGQPLELGNFVELIDFGMILGYHDWGV